MNDPASLTITPVLVAELMAAWFLFATRVVSRHGGTADAVVSLPGVVNRVLRVTGPGLDWVVRTPADLRRPNEFPAEIWAAERAGRSGVATPRTVATWVGDHPRGDLSQQVASGRGTETSRPPASSSRQSMVR